MKNSIRELSQEEQQFRKKLFKIMEEVDEVNRKVMGEKKVEVKETSSSQHKRHQHLADLKDDEEEEAEEETEWIAQPSSIIRPMRDYQLECLNWLAALHRANACGIIADEMGLGKTLETISFLAYLKESHPTLIQRHLIVVPKSTINNWLREFNNFCPTFRVIQGQGETPEERDYYMAFINNDMTFEAVLTTAETLNTSLALFKKVEWDQIVLDEGHKIKNDQSLLANNVRALRSSQRLLLTGTPIQNNIRELWALLNFLMPRIFNNSSDFEKIFNYISADTENKYQINRLTSMIQPFIIRRLKIHVEKALLPKKEIILFVGMSELQKQWQKNMIQRNFKELTDKDARPMCQHNILMQLRKVCNHPQLFPDAEEKPQVDGDHIFLNCEKMRVLDLLLVKLYRDKHKVLIFSQFTSMLDIIEDYCNYKGYNYCRLDGSTKSIDRMQAIDSFQDHKENKFVFLLSTKAGGLGINLTAADTVILYDIDWNPQNDKQAEDRAHRIGQTRQVVIQKLITEGSLEYKICERSTLKLKLDHLIIQSGGLTKNQLSLNKQDQKAILEFGLADILKLDTKTRECNIDRIIEHSFDTFSKDIGVKAQKLEAEFNLRGLDQESVNTFIYEGTDFKNERMDKEVNLIDFTKEVLGTRRKNRKERERPNWRTEVGTVHPFQFWDEKRLDELDKKKFHWETNKHESDFDQRLAWTEEDAREQKRLLNNPFGDWTKKDFNTFIAASAKHGRNNIDAISRELNKPIEETKNQHKNFWNNQFKIDNVSSQISRIEKGEDEIRKKNMAQNVFHWLCREEHPELGVSLSLPGNSPCQNEEDKHLMILLLKNKFDYEGVLKELRQHEQLMQSFTLRHITTEALKKRMERILKTYEKDFKANIAEQERALALVE